MRELLHGDWVLRARVRRSIRRLNFRMRTTLFRISEFPKQENIYNVPVVYGTDSRLR